MISNPPFIGQTVTLDSVEFVSPDGKKEVIPLSITGWGKPLLDWDKKSYDSHLNPQQEIQKAINDLSDEDWDGIIIWFNVEKPNITIVDQMDWCNGNAGDKLKHAIAHAIGDEANIIWHNEGGTPEGPNWVKLEKNVKSLNWGKKSTSVQPPTKISAPKASTQLKIKDPEVYEEPWASPPKPASFDPDEAIEERNLSKEETDEQEAQQIVSRESQGSSRPVYNQQNSRLVNPRVPASNSAPTKINGGKVPQQSPFARVVGPPTIEYSPSREDSPTIAYKPRQEDEESIWKDDRGQVTTPPGVQEVNTAAQTPEEMKEEVIEERNPEYKLPNLQDVVGHPEKADVQEAEWNAPQENPRTDLERIQQEASEVSVEDIRKRQQELGNVTQIAAQELAKLDDPDIYPYEQNEVLRKVSKIAEDLETQNELLKAKITQIRKQQNKKSMEWEGKAISASYSPSIAQDVSEEPTIKQDIGKLRQPKLAAAERKKATSTIINNLTSSQQQNVKLNEQLAKLPKAKQEEVPVAKPLTPDEALGQISDQDQEELPTAQSAKKDPKRDEDYELTKEEGEEEDLFEGINVVSIGELPAEAQQKIDVLNKELKELTEKHKNQVNSPEELVKIEEDIKSTNDKIVEIERQRIIEEPDDNTSPEEVEKYKTNLARAVKTYVKKGGLKPDDASKTMLSPKQVEENKKFVKDTFLYRSNGGRGQNIPAVVRVFSLLQNSQFPTAEIVDELNAQILEKRKQVAFNVITGIAAFLEGLFDVELIKPVANLCGYMFGEAAIPVAEAMAEEAVKNTAGTVTQLQPQPPTAAKTQLGPNAQNAANVAMVWKNLVGTSNPSSPGSKAKAVTLLKGMRRLASGTKLSAQEIANIENMNVGELGQAIVELIPEKIVTEKSVEEIFKLLRKENQPTPTQLGSAVPPPVLPRAKFSRDEHNAYLAGVRQEAMDKAAKIAAETPEEKTAREESEKAASAEHTKKMNDRAFKFRVDPAYKKLDEDLDKQIAAGTLNPKNKPEVIRRFWQGVKRSTKEGIITLEDIADVVQNVGIFANNVDQIIAEENRLYVEGQQNISSKFESLPDDQREGYVEYWRESYKKHRKEGDDAATSRNKANVKLDLIAQKAKVKTKVEPNTSTQIGSEESIELPGQGENKPPQIGEEPPEGSAGVKNPTKPKPVRPKDSNELTPSVIKGEKPSKKPKPLSKNQILKKGRVNANRILIKNKITLKERKRELLQFDKDRFEYLKDHNPTVADKMARQELILRIEERKNTKLVSETSSEKPLPLPEGEQERLKSREQAKVRDLSQVLEKYGNKLNPLARDLLKKVGGNPKDPKEVEQVIQGINSSLSGLHDAIDVEDFSKYFEPDYIEAIHADFNDRLATHFAQGEDVGLAFTHALYGSLNEPFDQLTKAVKQRKLSKEQVGKDTLATTGLMDGILKNLKENPTGVSERIELTNGGHIDLLKSEEDDEIILQAPTLGEKTLGWNTHAPPPRATSQKPDSRNYHRCFVEGIPKPCSSMSARGLSGIASLNKVKALRKKYGRR